MQGLISKIRSLSSSETSKMSRFPFLTRSQKGFSLMEIVVSTGVVSIISLSTAMLIAQGNSVANFGEFQASLEQRHNLNVQKIRNTPKLVSALGLSTAVATSPCFRRLVEDTPNCTSFVSSPNPLRNMPPLFAGETAADYVGTTTDGLIRYSVQYEVVCTTTLCTEIRIIAETEPTAAAIARGLVAKKRRTEIAIPTSFLASKDNLRFDCSNSATKEVIMSINYGTQRTSCTAYTSASTCTNVPANSFGGTAAGCKSVTNNNCANNRGLRTIGMLTAQSTCNVP